MKMKRVIEMLCVLGVLFTITIGIVGINIGKSIAEDARYIYSYKEYSDIINEVDIYFLQVKLINFEIEKGYHEEYEEVLKALNERVQKRLDKYNSTEYEEAEEEQYVKNIEAAYNKYYNFTLDKIQKIKNGQTVSEEDIMGMDSSELEFIENIQSIQDYISYWAKNDYDGTEVKVRKATITYITIILISLAIFISTALIVAKIFDREVKVINSALKKVSEGELDMELECDGNNEFDYMKSSINKTVHNFGNIISGIKEQSGDIDNKAENLSHISSELAVSVDNVQSAVGNITTGIEEQATDLQDINSILNEFANKISEFIENVAFLDNSAGVIINKTNEGTVKMDELSKAFEQVNALIKSFTDKIFVLSKTVKEISGITNFINDISEQTNLLALNAAIESARVGEAGKGFAVVAEQIRTLAEQSKEYVNSISELINDVSRETNEISKDGDVVNGKVNESMVIINDSLASFNEIITEINDIASKIGILNSTAKEIDEDKEIIHEKVDKSSNIAEQIASSSGEVLESLSEINSNSKNVEKTSVELNDVTTVLEGNVNIFKTK